MRVWILAIAVAISSPAIAESPAQEFEAAWAQRAQNYADDEARAQAFQESAVEQFRATDTPEDANRLIGPALSALAQWGYAQGREFQLQDFLRMRAEKPSAARVELYFQERQDALQRLFQNAQEQANALKEIGSMPPEEYVSKVLETASRNGVLQGAADELALLDQNSATLQQATDERSERRRRTRAAMLGGLGAALANSNSGWSATCTRTGSFTHCSGN
jgi:hypothetical protein